MKFYSILFYTLLILSLAFVLVAVLTTVFYIINHSYVTIGVETKHPLWITSSTVMLMGKVNSRYLQGLVYYFEYTTNGTKITTDQYNLITDNFGTLVIDLIPDTTYRFRAVIISMGRHHLGSFKTFSTLQEPIVETEDPVYNGNDTFTCRGHVVNFGSDYLYSMFTFGLAMDPDTMSSPAVLTIVGNNSESFRLNGLEKMKYECRMVAFEKFDSHLFRGQPKYFGT